MSPPSRALLLDLAGPRAFQRGEDYARQAQVEIVSSSQAALLARVRGGDLYTVELSWSGDRLIGACDCPVGQRSEFCKHQVAAGLVWSDQADVAAGQAQARSASVPRRPADEAETLIAAWLQASSAESLRSLVGSLAESHADIRRELAARARFSGQSAEARRKAVSELIGRKRFLDWRASAALATRLRALTALLGEQLERDPADTADLAAHALLRLFALYADSDDGGGHLGEVIGRVASLHHRAACASTGLDGRSFAKGWLKLKLADQWGMVPGVEAYAAILGSAGIAVLEKTVGQRLDAVPAAKPAASRWARQWQVFSGETLVLLSLSEQLARHGADVDAMLARRARVSLVSAHDYLELHALCQDHGRQRLAIQWLERGLAAWPDDTNLLDALVQVRRDEGFSDEALELAWRAFVSCQDPAHYLHLREQAQADQAWPQWRARALALARETDGDAAVVPLHLAEGDIDAIIALLPAVKLPAHVWERLPDALEPGHPELALRVLRTLVQSALAQTHKHAYRSAMLHLQRIGVLHRRLGEVQAWNDYLSQLRVEHRAKRSFIAMLDDDRQLGRHQ